MSELKISKLVKLILVGTVPLGGLAYVSTAVAGDITYPEPPIMTPYPVPATPLPPIAMPVQVQYQGQAQNQLQYQGQTQSQLQGQGQFQGQGQGQGQSQSKFTVAVDVSGSYNIVEINDGVTTTKSTQKLIELRPYLSYGTLVNDIEFGGAVMTSLIYELGGTPAYALGRTEADFLVKKAGDFALGAKAGYNRLNFSSTSPDPVELGSYTEIDASAFAEKRFGQFGVSVTGSYVQDTHDGTLQGDTSTFSEADRDKREIGAALRLNYHFDDAISIFAEGSYGNKRYVVVAVPSRNQTEYGIRLGGTYNFSAEIAAEIAGQYAYHQVECGCTTHLIGGDAKLVAAFGGGFSGYVSANAEYAKSTDAALNSKAVGVAAEVSVLVAQSIQLSAGASYDLAFYGPNEGNSISANADVRYGVTDNIDIFAGVNYGYKTTANPGWARNYGATVGVSLHN